MHERTPTMTTFEELVDPGSELLSKSALHACSDGRNALGALLTEGLLDTSPFFFPAKSGPSLCLSGHTTELTKLTLCLKRKRNPKPEIRLKPLRQGAVQAPLEEADFGRP